MPSRRAVLVAAALMPLFARTAAGGERSVYAPGGLAIGGVDPVAYFTSSGPVMGAPENALKWRGAVWRFVSVENRIAFEGAPRRYAPRFGGYCAMALAEGALLASVPEAWTIHHGRLYLNASLAERVRWRSDIAGNVARAEANWPKVLG